MAASFLRVCVAGGLAGVSGKTVFRQEIFNNLPSVIKIYGIPVCFKIPV
jgi:hypothetical protein